MKFPRWISSGRFSLLFSGVVGGLALYLALRRVDLSAVWNSLLRSNPWYVGLAAGYILLNHLAKTVRCKYLLGAESTRVSLWQCFQAVMVAQMLNLAYPGRLGDLARAYWIGRLGPGTTFVFGTIVVEKSLDMVFYVGLLVWLMIWIPLPVWMRGSVYPLVVLTLLALIGIVLLLYRKRWVIRFLEYLLTWFPERVRHYLSNRLQAGISSVNVLSTQQGVVWLAVWSLVLWISAILTNSMVLGAVGLDLPVSAAVFILLAVQAGITFAQVPMAIGIFEYLSILTLAVFGISQPQALSFGFLLHGLIIFPVLVLGLVFLVWAGLGPQRLAVFIDER